VTDLKTLLELSTISVDNFVENSRVSQLKPVKMRPTVGLPTLDALCKIN
jgi:hypothetical protein